MSDYTFYVGHLRFIANRTGRVNEEVSRMMDILEDIANQIETKSAFKLKAQDLRLGSRALAGVAGFLQKQILPEVVAAQNEAGEKQVRWVIDTSMAFTSKILMHAEITSDKDDLELDLPKAP
ncbi:hypothetical protein WH95_15445 [Kiloniella litopenaei]|uniref:Uncharacterized protein n=1 Tax=Kiloniella litopenaei TaxID=1549748 RepID=A0A0M2R689_9PROT|nr:hypothetical protein [Kiloniella litopenaei]KKJ75959.1 hypothetical protein WH95_15445 [Kiloniella litopenaei]